MHLHQSAQIQHLQTPRHPRVFIIYRQRQRGQRCIAYKVFAGIVNSFKLTSYVKLGSTRRPAVHQIHQKLHKRGFSDAGTIVVPDFFGFVCLC